MTAWQKPFAGIQLNRTHPLSKGIVGCWLFNEGSGGKVFDYSGEGNEGVINGAVWTHGKTGSSLNFSTDYIDLANVSLGLTTNATFSAIVKADALDGAFHTIVGKRSTAGNYPYVFAVNTNSVVIFASDLTPANGGDIALPSTSWHHVVGTIDTNREYATYIDGVPGANTAITGGTISESSEPFFLGLNYAGAAFGPWAGKIDNVMIWNRALAASEVQNLYLEPYSMFSIATPAKYFFMPVAVTPSVEGRVMGGGGGGISRKRKRKRTPKTMLQDKRFKFSIEEDDEELMQIIKMITGGDIK